MNNGSVCGRHYLTGQAVEVAWAAGKISTIKPATNAPESVWLAPALVDLQVNGFAGVDFQGAGCSAESLARVVNGLAASACTRCLFTIVTDEWALMCRRLSDARRLLEADAALRRVFFGWHLEGPFLSAQPGFSGAHDPACMRDPQPDDLRVVRELVRDDRVLWTLAPERSGACPFIEEAAAVGFQISLGHSDATRSQLEGAIRAGAACYTHLANGCPQLLDRHDNILWRVVESPIPFVSLIPDGMHVSASLFRLLHRLLPAGVPLYVSDAMAAAGAPPGRYRLGRLELEVGVDQAVRQPGRSNYAGSALRPLDGVFRAAAMLGCAWQEAWDRFSTLPARMMKIDHGLHVGARADLCELRFREIAGAASCSEDNALALVQSAERSGLAGLRVFCAGEQVFHGGGDLLHPQGG